MPLPSHPSSATSELPLPVKDDLVRLAANLTDALMLMDKDFRILYANPMALRISHLTEADFNGKTLWEHYPGVLESNLGQAYLQAVATREERVVEGFYYGPLNTTFDLRIFPMESGVGVHYRDVTAQRLSEQHQRTLEDRVRVTMQAANGVGMWDWDILADRIYADVRFCALYGVDPSHATAGAPLSEFTRNIHPDDAGPVGALIESALRTGPFNAQYRILQLDGSIRWVATRGNVVFDNHGKPTRFPGVALDITEQKEREEALRISEERYRVLTELNPQSLWTANPEGLVLYANQRFLEYIGKEFVPKTGTEYIACFDPEDRDRVVEVWTHSVVTGEEYDIRARLLRASDGASRWWHVWARPIRDPNGVIQQWLGLATDIHDEHLAQTQLHAQYAELDRQRSELEAIYNTSPVGMALYDAADLHVLRINQRHAEIFGIDPAAAVGMKLPEITPAMTAAHDLVRRAASGESVLNHTAEGVLDVASGQHRSFNVNYSPVFNEDGTVRAVAGAVVETTHLKLAEKALIQTEKLAAVGRMASSIAHEINNPLESVMNLIFLARSYAVNPDAQKFLEMADQELRRVSIIANQTLRFHKQASNPRAITATDLLSTVLSLYEGRLRNSNIEVDTSRLGGSPVACFEGDIRQVLNNLVGNAIDAMPTGGRLTLRARDVTHHPTGRPGLLLTVADTGAGMSAETQTRIFEAFFTTKGISGTGLGLWISAGIMDRHNGHLRLHSCQRESHHGSVFTLFLPFKTTIVEKP